MLLEVLASALEAFLCHLVVRAIRGAAVHAALPAPYQAAGSSFTGPAVVDSGEEDDNRGRAG